MDQKPSVGRIVHYVSYGTPNKEYSSRCVAAIITDVATSPETEEDSVRLKIFNPDGDFNSPWLKQFEKDPGSEENYKPGTWHWPERV